MRLCLCSAHALLKTISSPYLAGPSFDICIFKFLYDSRLYQTLPLISFLFNDFSAALALPLFQPPARLAYYTLAYNTLASTLCQPVNMHLSPKLQTLKREKLQHRRLSCLMLKRKHIGKFMLSLSKRTSAVTVAPYEQIWPFNSGQFLQFMKIIQQNLER